MLHPSFEPDTLFLIFEEDWRLEKPSTFDIEDEGAGKLYGVVLQGTKPVGSNYYIPTAKDSASKSEHGSVVGDLVSVVTKAARLHHGDLVWMTWQPGQGEVKKGSTKIRSGAMLISLSMNGAKALSSAIESGMMPVDHWDQVLLRYLYEKAPNFASYVLPPIGNYCEHVSGCEPEFSESPRPTCWDTKWVCPGTRRSEDPQKRDKWLVVMAKKGQGTWLSKFDLEKDYDALEWKTFWSVPDSIRPDRRTKAAEDARIFAAEALEAARRSPQASASSQDDMTCAGCVHSLYSSVKVERDVYYHFLSS